MEEWTLISHSNDTWITLVLGFNFLLFVFTKWRFEETFFSFFRLIDRSTHFNNYAEKSLLKQGFIFCLSFFSIANISLLGTSIMAHYGVVDYDFFSFLFIFSSTFTVIILRHCFQLILGNLLGLEDFLHQFQFRNSTYLFRLSVLLYLGLIFNQYTPQFSNIFLNGFLVLMLTTYLITQLLVIKDFFSTINRGGLYFILYLCTLKLSPWILLFGGLKK